MWSLHSLLRRKGLIWHTFHIKYYLKCSVLNHNLCLGGEVVDVIVDEVKRVGFYVKIYEYIVLSIMKQRTTHMVVSLAWKMLWLRGPGGGGLVSMSDVACGVINIEMNKLFCGVINIGANNNHNYSPYNASTPHHVSALQNTYKTPIYHTHPTPCTIHKNGILFPTNTHNPPPTTI